MTHGVTSRLAESHVVDLLTIVYATTNEGKLTELRALLGDLPVHLVGVKDAVHSVPKSLEKGATFEENARSKAEAVSRASGLIAIADDSGLEVEGLGGRPGVRSARFAHDRATDAENNAALLRELEEHDGSARKAQFRCVLAVANPWDAGNIAIVEGRLVGSIARTPRGSGGFGYDPLFVVDDDGRAVAELSEEEKQRVSHRALAARALEPILFALVKRQIGDVERAVG